MAALSSADLLFPPMMSSRSSAFATCRILLLSRDTKRSTITIFHIVSPQMLPRRPIRQERLSVKYELQSAVSQQPCLFNMRMMAPPVQVIKRSLEVDGHTDAVLIVLKVSGLFSSTPRVRGKTKLGGSRIDQYNLKPIH